MFRLFLIFIISTFMIGCHSHKHDSSALNKEQKATSKSSSDSKNIIDEEGVNLIYQKLKGILEKHNLKKMDIKVGDDFNSEIHEAITSTPSDKKLKGKIVDVIEDGYMIGEKILRFGKVVIGS